MKNRVIISNLYPQIDRFKGIIKTRARDLNLSIPKKRVLYFLHENVYGITGGTGQTAKDILEEIDEEFECYILVSSGTEIVLWKKKQYETNKT